MENIPHGLKEAIEKDELVLFIGAGLSWDLKNTEGKTLGGWKEMVSSMLSYLKDKKCITAEEQQSCEELGPIKALQRLENNKIDKRVIGHFVKRYFKLGKENNFSLQEKLYSLSTKIITTNYDLAFEKPIKKLRKEKAYKGQNQKLSKLMGDPVFLFKLHGCITKIKSLVLFPSDYRKLYNNYDRDAAFTLLAFKFLIFSKTFLFIGTGMDESQIINFFEEIKDIRRFYNQEHYIITTDPLSIPTNFLTPIKINDYAEIPSYIDQLVNIKKNAEEEKNPEKKQLLEQLEASEKENEVLAKVLYKEKNKNKIQALYLEREANNRFLTGLKHHIAKEYLEAIEEYKAATELKPEYSEAYNNWGNALCLLAKTKSGNEAEELYKEACKKYDKAITYKQDYHEAYYNWGVALDDLAKTKSSNEAEELYKEACKKYDKAITYKQDFYEAYHNWGSVLGDLAQTKSGSEAEKLYKEACEKYNKATTYKQDIHEAYNNWGNVLGDLAQTKSGNEAEELFKEAFEKYNLATTYKEDFHQAYNNWGNVLGDLAETKSGNKAEELYTKAFEKYKLATTYKKDNHEAYYNWGNALCQLAKIKSGNEAEELYKEACEKYNLATTYKKDLHQAYYNWGTALCQLAKIKSGNEAEELYEEAFEKYKLATTYKRDKHEAYDAWGVALMKLAKIKPGNEAEELYEEAFEKYKLATKYKKDFHEAYYNWGLALVELAKTKSGSEAEKLYQEAFKKYNLAIKYGGNSYNLACLYAIRNQKAEALKYLEQTLARNEFTVDFVEQDEDWKNLRNDPDFQDLLSRYKK